MKTTEKELQELRKRVRSGYPVGEIRTELETKGFSTEETDEIINSLSNNSERSEKNEYRFNDSDSLPVLAGITMIILGLGFVPVAGWDNAITLVLLVAGVILLLPKLLKMISRHFQR